MTTKPLLLDLFCCAGGASTGFTRAGFEVFGVDINPQPRYPYTFFQGDALQIMDHLLAGYGVHSLEHSYLKLDSFAAFAASPPCQAFSGLSDCQPGTKEKYPNLIPQTRELFRATGKPYCIENVPGAPLDATVGLCGSMFGKRLHLHREFETNFLVSQPECRHDGYVLNPHSTAGRDRMRAEFGKHANLAKLWREEKGVPWMSWDESSEAIIPDYTEYIGKYMMRAVERAEDLRMAA